jgi:fructose-1,6-bisphosphatase/inositol monophosphatase family enzyme
VTEDELVAVCRRATRAVRSRLATFADWGLRPGSASQHHSDLAADAAAVEVLVGCGLGVLSEESGITGSDRPLLAVLDPLDGSTNAAQGVPWFACSLCVVDDDGPRVALVTNLASGVEHRAVRGGGAWRGEVRLRTSGCGAVEQAFVGLAGLPPGHLGWRQFRALGAAALDLSAVAEGVLDGWFDCSDDAHGVWDYLGGLLICREAGGAVLDAEGRDLVVLDPSVRRAPVAGATPGLAEELARRLSDARREQSVAAGGSAR